jgi:hypothetical protein
LAEGQDDFDAVGHKDFRRHVSSRVSGLLLTTVRQ